MSTLAFDTRKAVNALRAPRAELAAVRAKIAEAKAGFKIDIAAL